MVITGRLLGRDQLAAGQRSAGLRQWRPAIILICLRPASHQRRPHIDYGDRQFIGHSVRFNLISSIERLMGREAVGDVDGGSSGTRVNKEHFDGTALGQHSRCGGLVLLLLRYLLDKTTYCRRTNAAAQKASQRPDLC